MKKAYLQVVYGALAVFIFGFVSCPVMGQVATKIPLTGKDYHLWGTLQTRALSDNGNWVSYSMSYPSGADTLFVLSTKTQRKYVLPKALDSRFIQENIFAYRKNNSLILLNLSNGTETGITNVSNYRITANENYLVTEEPVANESKKLCIRNLQGKLLQSIDEADKYVWNEAKTKILCTTTGSMPSVTIISLVTKPQVKLVCQNANTVYSALTWQENGEDVVFYRTSTKSDKQSEVVYLNSKENKYYSLNETGSGFPKNFRIDTNSNIALKLSTDGSKVFFGIQSILEKPDKENFEGVEIWNANDKIIYPERKLKASVGNTQLLAVWWPKTGKVSVITSEEESWIMLTGNQQYAITANPMQYEPEYKLFADRDFYLTELASGNKIKLLEKQSGQQEMIRVQPNGKYIVYFREGNWWSYDTNLNKHRNITKQLQSDWDNRKTDPGAQLNVWGLAGFTSDYKSVLLYDYYDVWLIDLEGKKSYRLTKGKETKTRFRIKVSPTSYTNYSGLPDALIDLKDTQILTALNLYDGSNGFHELRPNKSIISLVTEQGAAGRLLLSKNDQAFVYETQKFDVPPSLMFKVRNEVNHKIIYKSNPHHDKYFWGKSEMIHYKAPSGNELNGALFYPANYKPGQKYPMIVWIYDTVSRELNQYVNPTLNNPIGLNITNFTSKGYFVLLPDIEFQKGSPGKSALDCVTTAVNKVIDMGYTEQGKIGLKGQSFGAYETNYIISQTNLFSAAVSGAGVSDVARHYFTLNKEDNKIDAWRYENQQYRMGKSFFENPQGYLDNSPLMQAAGINTPLLTWAGLQDENVLPEQALTFYIALRRLNKKHIMLRYPNDGHIFVNGKNQIDLTNRIQQWFDHFLKKEPAAAWIQKGTE
ncbi:alpha/beta hydrolase family protein [Flavobacterium suncheonense]|uniref:alpha/beta hydrolase family protein n=1 Tax=Flavobacterium suncheonense TaxID=350894 RepID=UPI003FA36693